MNVDFNIAELLSCLWKCTTEHGGYVCFEEELKNLQSEMEILKGMSNHLKSRVEATESENMKPLPNVEWWILRVGVMENEVNELINRASQEIQNNCLGNCCPRNCRSRYKIGKEIQRKLGDVNAQKSEGAQFETVATPVEGAFDKAWSCLGEDVANIVGICGKGGIGKTTVLTQISNNLITLHSQHHFDFVLWVVASQDLNLERIQSDIGKEMGFVDRWKDKSPQERAGEIFKVLSHKRFLLLLDDIWGQVDLTEVGVPTPNRENASKLMFTTRTEEVCSQMGAEEIIEVNRLPEKKAWELFREKVGEDTLTIHPEVPQLAQTIAKMCDGLPLALITVGRAMASKKTLHEWRHSVVVLRKNVSQFSGTKDPVFTLIKFSYDSLPNDTIKACFLYCTLFPEDYSINKFNLIDYWIGEGFLGEFNARNEGHKIISTLIDACLLEDEGICVKMHDLIREVALWIACEYEKLKNKYLVEAGTKLSEAPEVGSWESVRRMSLMANHIQNLTNAPRSNNLLTLFLGNNHLKMISSSFFEIMPSLKVMDLSENRELTELPSGISKIDSLQYLNLSRTGIKQLPIELRNLVKLRCLNLECTYALQTIPVQVIACFSNLNVLRMLHCASSDQVVGDGIRTGGPESMIRDLQHLECLNVLTITTRSEYALEVFKSFDKFQTCTHVLSLQHFKYSRSLNISFLEDMKLLDELEFIDCIHLKELNIDESLIKRGGHFNSLRKVSIVGCSKLADLTWFTLAPNIEFLIVSRCSNMEEIICRGKLGGRDVSTLAKLEVLQLVSLPKLKSIYPTALPFPYLKEIVVDDCPKLQKLPLNSNSGKDHRIVIQGWEDWWKNLEWEDEATRSAFLLSFKACMY